ncbi:UNVERIFIED_ORG: hypothetical protein J2W82_000857 [Pseudomonas mohnii]|nr:hypothetical protein [Pseudomonas mohnii]
MPQSKILVDTNVYLRLAKTVRPLLFVIFGESEYCLYILPELNEELKSNKLQSKFGWVSEEEFLENRDHFPAVSKKQRKAIEQPCKRAGDSRHIAMLEPARALPEGIALLSEF